MNLVLFESHEFETPLRRNDPRTNHLRCVLLLRTGDSFDCGLVDGPRGKATIVQETADLVHLSFEWRETPPPLDPVTLLIGLPRPQTVRKILAEVTALGVARILFFRSERSEPSYADSNLWSSGEVRRRLVEGAQQAFCTRLPEVALLQDLPAAVNAIAPDATRIALDNYESPTALSRVPMPGIELALAIGSERGWTRSERSRLRDSGFTLAHLGPRVLRTETAAVVAVAIAKSLRGVL